MKININGVNFYLSMPDKTIVDGVEQIKIVPLDDYCQLGSKKINGIMYELEQFLSELIGKKVNLKQDFEGIRKKILDSSGFLYRIPNEIIIKEGDENGT